MINAIIRSKGTRQATLQRTMRVLINLGHGSSSLERWTVAVVDIWVELDGRNSIRCVADGIRRIRSGREVLVGEHGGGLRQGPRISLYEVSIDLYLEWFGVVHDGCVLIVEFLGAVEKRVGR